MKKIISSFLALTFIISSVLFNTSAVTAGTDEPITYDGIKAYQAATLPKSGKCGPDVTYTLADDGTLTISGTGGMYDYYTFEVDSDFISPFCFDSGIKAVVVENGVTSIGDHAFSCCPGLKSVSMADSVTSIGLQAFYDCSVLENVTVPSSVAIIGSQAFYGCSSLKYNVYENGNYLGSTVSPYHVLMNTVTKDMTSFNIHDTTVIILEGAFSDCRSLEDISIPNSISIIGNDAFSGCNSLIYNETLDGYYLGNTDNPYLVLMGIDKTMLDGNEDDEDDNFFDFAIHEDTRVIFDNAFYKIRNLKSVYIPSGVRSIGKNAFYICNNLGEVDLPDTLTSIGEYAFSGCKSLSSIEIPRSVTNIELGVFAVCNGLKTVTMPSDGMLKIIGAGAFFECRALKSITIPSSVTAMRSYRSLGSTGAFVNCTALETVTIAHGSLLTRIDPLTFDTCTALKTVNIPSDSLINGIGSRSFSSCSALESITIPSSVTVIGFGTRTESNYVYYNTFGGCTSLKSITIPSSVTSIDEPEFEDCPSDLVVRCYKNSYAEEYATTNSIKVAYINAPEPLGGQIKQTSPAGLRFGFSLENLTQTPESFYVLVKKPEGEWKRVDITKFYNTEKTVFTLCITNIPDSAKNTLFTAKTVAVFADGSEEEGYEVSLSYNKVADAINNGF